MIRAQEPNVQVACVLLHTAPLSIAVASEASAWVSALRGAMRDADWPGMQVLHSLLLPAGRTPMKTRTHLCKIDNAAENERLVSVSRCSGFMSRAHGKSQRCHVTCAVGRARPGS